LTGNNYRVQKILPVPLCDREFSLIFSYLMKNLFGLPVVVFRRLCLPGNSILRQTGYIEGNGGVQGLALPIFPHGPIECPEIEDLR
jgi:hypothetical protein